MTRVVHISDTHGSFFELPEADLYVHTGDIYPTIGAFLSVDNSRRREWRLVPSREKVAQEKWSAKKDPENQWRNYLGSPLAPVVCVRGNHDFADAALVFRGCAVTELVDNELHEIAGLRITGHRGVPPINGMWSDEVFSSDLLDRAKAMPTADVYVTHYPPHGVLDNVGRVHLGLSGLANALSYREFPPRGAYHLFGHIHERGGETLRAGSILFSNAATKMCVIDIP